MTLIKKTLKMSFVLSGFMLSTFTTYAQTKTIKQVQHITEKMAKKLSLTEEQKAKVYQINLERTKRHEDAYKQGRKKEVIKTAVAKWENDLKQVLNVQQAQKLGL